MPCVQAALTRLILKERIVCGLLAPRSTEFSTHVVAGSYIPAGSSDFSTCVAFELSCICFEGSGSLVPLYLHATNC